MGRKISVDSATMMNKGLEVIEAHWLFGAPLEAIEVVVHPQSVIHSMVEYARRLGDRAARRARHAHADRLRARLARSASSRACAPLDFTTLGALEFERVDLQRFPCVRLAYEAMRARAARRPRR